MSKKIEDLRDTIKVILGEVPTKIHHMTPDDVEEIFKGLKPPSDISAIIVGHTEHLSDKVHFATHTKASTPDLTPDDVREAVAEWDKLRLRLRGKEGNLMRTVLFYITMGLIAAALVAGFWLENKPYSEWGSSKASSRPPGR